MFGIFIQLAQPFENRSGEVGDVFAEVCGIALGCAVGFVPGCVDFTVNW